MKTNKLRNNRISILFSLTAILLFSFNVSAQLYVNTSNNVGVGTSLPQQNLSVNYGANIDQASVNTGSTASALTFGGSSGEGIGSKRTPATGNQYGLDFYTQSINRMCITNSGNVGVGTTAPTAALEVAAGNIIINKASANNQIGVTRSTYTLGASLNLNTSTTNDWIIGERGFISNSDFRIYSYGTATDVMLIQKSNGWVGIGTTIPGYKLDVQGGDINASGSVRSAGLALTSDKKFKTNITPISNALSIIKKLKPSSYYWDTASNKVYGMNFTGQKQYGLISQDVEQFLPELISNANKRATYDSTGKLLTQAVTFKAMNYNAFIPIMMQAIQEQQKTIDSLQSQIKNCCSQNQNRVNGNNNGNGDNKGIGSINVELSDVNAIVLNDAVPNPFAEQTMISYNIPKIENQAQILFYDSNGKLIKSVDIKTAGKGQLNVFANDLSNGTYSYTLIVDGKIVATKRMIRQQ